MSETDSITCWQLSHGESESSRRSREWDIFVGGEPDDIPGRNPIRLTDNGRLQGALAGLAARRAGLVLEQICVSPMLRARQTALDFSLNYCGGVTFSNAETFKGFREISHGTLEQEPAVPHDVARSHRITVVRVMQHLLAASGLDHTLAEGYAGWVAPLGRGDGETYLGSGLRGLLAANEYLASNVLFVSHNGTMRGARVLGAALTTEQQQYLADEHEELEAAQTLSRKRLQAEIMRWSWEEELDPDQLEDILAPTASAARAMILLLREFNIPRIGHARQANKLGNGVLAQVTIGSDGKWQRGGLIEPALIDPDAEPTVENVNAEFQPYGPKSAWV